MAYVANKASTNVRPVTTITQDISISLCFDKHYILRHDIGDKLGKRDGIGNADVEALVLRSFRHLMLYCSCVPTLSFVNYNEGAHSKPRQPYRVVCREETACGMLNIAIQVHVKAFNHYEITVITAMCKDEYRFFDGQYGVLMVGNNSILERFVDNSLTEISSI